MNFSKRSLYERMSRRQNSAEYALQQTRLALIWAYHDTRLDDADRAAITQAVLTIDQAPVLRG